MASMKTWVGKLLIFLLYNWSKEGFELAHANSAKSFADAAAQATRAVLPCRDFLGWAVELNNQRDEFIVPFWKSPSFPPFSNQLFLGDSQVLRCTFSDLQAGG